MTQLYAALKNLLDAVMERPDQCGIESVTLSDAYNALAAASDEPLWIVNDLGELGVKVGDRFFFLYKGDNLEYGKNDAKDGVALHEDGTPMHYRIVGKREFGETCGPESWVRRGFSEARYTQPLTFIPGLSFGNPEDGEWKQLPATPTQQEEGGK